MAALQEEETPIDKAIVDELVTLTPEWWGAAVLTIEYSKDGDVEKYSHEISSPEGHKEPVTPSEELFDLTHRLGLLFRRHGKQWKRATYRANAGRDETWRYTVDFEY